MFKDFKELSVINISLDNGVTVEKIEKIVIDSKIPEDEKIKAITNSYLGIE